MRRCPRDEVEREALKILIEEKRKRAQLSDIKAERIPEGQSFLEWVDELIAAGLKVDGRPFTFDGRGALRALYAAVPYETADLYRHSMTVMKGAQTGLTVMSMLLQIYIALRHYPAKVGVYYPDMKLAAYVSSNRFMPILRGVPAAYRLLTQQAGKSRGEGNVLTRSLGESEVLFLWVSGSSITESFPLDVVVYDESQNMLVDDIEKTKERMSASAVRWWFMCSTAKWPDADVDYFYRRGTRHQFRTRCGCDGGIILDESFPECIVYNTGQVEAAPVDDYVYVCPHCKTYIPDPHDGEWVAGDPSAKNLSYHYPQTLSATVSPGEIIEAFHAATDKQNFYNRKLGKPYSDPSQIPITDAVLNACAEAGAKAGIAWKTAARESYMGIDQMGAYNVAIIRERLPDGRSATIHVEEVFSDDPFGRCDILMKIYGVQVCVVETLPNFNDAKRFAARHKGKVFLASYTDMPDDMIRWGDEPSANRSDRRTSEDARVRYTVLLDQYKVMQTAMRRMVDTALLFPDPDGLVGESLVGGEKKPVSVLRNVVWAHFKRTALVVEDDPETRKKRRKVMKVGIDPHFSYANMLCEVAWSRAHGTSTFYTPEAPAMAKAGKQTIVDVVPEPLRQVLTAMPAEGCGACEAFESGVCRERGFKVKETDPSCPLFVAVS